MSILVTGAAGFVGSHVVDALVARGEKVVAFDDLSTGDESNLRKDVPFIEADVADPRAVDEAFTRHRVTAVVHQAARINTGPNLHDEDPAVDVRVSVLGTLAVIKACLAARARLVFASSVAVYGRPDPARLPVDEDAPREPIASYGIAKKCAEDYLRWHEPAGLSYACLRYANVYGPRQPVYGEVGLAAIAVERLAQGKPLTLFGDGSQTRDFVFVEDAVRATLLALDARANLVLNVGSGRPSTVNDVFAALEKAHGRFPVERKPLRPGELGAFHAGVARARKALGYEAKVGLEEGLRRTLDWRKSCPTS